MNEEDRTIWVDFPNWKVIEVRTKEGRTFIEIEQSKQPNANYYVMEEYEHNGQTYKRKICEI